MSKTFFAARAFVIHLDYKVAEMIGFREALSQVVYAAGGEEACSQLNLGTRTLDVQIEQVDSETKG